MLSIVVPCFNEKENLPKLFSSFYKSIITQPNRPEVEIIFVNNGSTDGSTFEFDKLLKDHEKEKIFTVVHLDNNCGYGGGILKGLEQAKGSTLCWTHADLQTDPNDVFIAYSKYKDASRDATSEILVKGHRKNRPFFDKFFSKGMEVYTNFVLNSSLQEINAQPKLFSKNLFKSFKSQAPQDFSLDLYILLYAVKNNVSILNFPVEFLERQHGESKGGGSLKGKLRLIIRTYRYINQTRNLF